MTTQVQTKKLQVALSAEERELKTKELARTIEQIPVLELEAKEIAKKWSDRLKAEKARALDLAGCVSTGKETREIPVTERVDPRRFVVETIRHDTMEVISERALTQDEMEELRQGDLFTQHAEGTADATDRAPANDTPPAPNADVLDDMAAKGHGKGGKKGKGVEAHPEHPEPTE